MPQAIDADWRYKYGNRTCFEGPRTIGFIEEPYTALASEVVRLQTLFLGISAGTELTPYRGSNPYLNKRWEPDPRLFVADNWATPAYPLVG